MIYKLRRRFILISAAAILAVVTLVFSIILALNISSMNRTMDILADRVSDGEGRFPGAFDEKPYPDMMRPQNKPEFDFITPETPFATRHFTVVFDNKGNVTNTFTESIYSITDDQAVEYAKRVVNGNTRGWADNYRYKVYTTSNGIGVVFIDGSLNRSEMMQSMTIAGCVLLGCSALVLILIFLLSKNAVKPIAESYEKQKQFVTNANHELKTPLTLILANLDIAESELGKNEWLDDIRAEGHRMTELVNQLVALSRMDEEGHQMNISEVYFGDLVADTVAEFEPLAKDREKYIISDVDKYITYFGDEALLHKLVGILMDNAIKYCDNGGEISVKLHKGRRVILTIENTYSAIEDIELNRLFDRFYRSDKSRVFLMIKHPYYRTFLMSLKKEKCTV